MNFTLFKVNMKKNILLLVIFFAVLTMYLTIMTIMFNPDDISAMQDLADLMPEKLIDSMGFSEMITDLTSYLSSWLYGLLMFAFPMVYSIILGNRLVAKMVDNSSFAYLLSTPNSRTKIIVTQGMYALFSMLVLFSSLFLVGLVVSQAVFPGLLNIYQFFRLNITTMLVNSVIIMITFFFSCLFNETKWSLAFGAGVPIILLMLKMLGDSTPELNMLKKVSIFGFYDPIELVSGSSMLLMNLIFIGMIVVLFVGSVLVFRKKQLPL